MRPNRRSALLITGLLLAGCGSSTGDVASTSSSAKTTVAGAGTQTTSGREPIAPCVDAPTQQSSGVVLTTPSGVELNALLLGSGTTGIVFVNQTGDAGTRTGRADTLCQWLPTEQAYAAKGYRTAVFTYSFSPADQDVVTVAKAMRAKGVTKIVLVGASLGGTAALAAASEISVSAVAALSPMSAFDAMNAAESVKTSGTPLLPAVGDGDDTNYVDNAHEIYDASTSKHKHLEVLHTSKHGIDLVPATVTLLDTFLTTYAAA